MVEMQLNDNTNVPNGFLIAIVVCTSLLVSVHMLALMISTCILPKIEAVHTLQNINIVEESPHEKMHWWVGWIRWSPWLKTFWLKPLQFAAFLLAKLSLATMT